MGIMGAILTVFDAKAFILPILISRQTCSELAEKIIPFVSTLVARYVHVINSKKLSPGKQQSEEHKILKRMHLIILLLLALAAFSVPATAGDWRMPSEESVHRAKGVLDNYPIIDG
jgi:hypothetical protein